ncbi:MAG: glycosyltransferase family 9 protein [Candidatus Melainabacteria bacterium]
MPLKPDSRILIVPLRFIGDTVLTMPMLARLRELMPKAHLSILVSRVTEPLLTPCPLIDEIQREPKGMLSTLRMLKTGRYDAVILLRKSWTMALLCQLAGIPVRAGYDKQRLPWGYRRPGMFLTHRAMYPSLKTRTHQIESHLGLLTALGFPPAANPPPLALWTTAEDDQRVDALLGECGIPADKPLAVVHPASASHGKQLPVEKYVGAIEQLHRSGHTVLATGVTQDQPLIAGLQRLVNVPIHDLSGRTSLRETVALYRRIRCLLTVDSSPVHLAAAAGVPDVVGVYGPTNERQWGVIQPGVTFIPVYNDLPCRPCYAKVCSHNNCRMQLPAESIKNAIKSVCKPALPAGEGGSGGAG